MPDTPRPRLRIAARSTERLEWVLLESMALREVERALKAIRPETIPRYSPGAVLKEKERDRNRTMPSVSATHYFRIKLARETLRTIQALGASLGYLRRRPLT
jgi:hypothetical protein